MGRDKRNEARDQHFTKMIRTHMETEAWRSLSTTAQALYPWLKLEWRGPEANNNGKIRLSLSQAAEKIGVNPKTIGNAFHDLQRKGFIVVTEPARLGVGGAAKSPAYELTEIELPNTGSNGGRLLFKGWSPGKDFAVHKAQANNPKGRNQKTKPQPENRDSTVVKMGLKK